MTHLGHGSTGFRGESDHFCVGQVLWHPILISGDHPRGEVIQRVWSSKGSGHSRGVVLGGGGHPKGLCKWGAVQPRPGQPQDRLRADIRDALTTKADLAARKAPETRLGESRGAKDAPQIRMVGQWTPPFQVP